MTDRTDNGLYYEYFPDVKVMGLQPHDDDIKALLNTKIEASDVREVFTQNLDFRERITQRILQSSNELYVARS